MFEFYEIIDIQPSHDRMDMLISNKVHVNFLIKGHSAILVYLDDELNYMTKAMRTSMVQEITKTKDMLIIKTMNNTYTLKRMTVLI